MAVINLRGELLVGPVSSSEQLRAARALSTPGDDGCRHVSSNKWSLGPMSPASGVEG